MRRSILWILSGLVLILLAHSLVPIAICGVSHRNCCSADTASAQYDLSGNDSVELVFTDVSDDLRLKWSSEDLVSGDVKELGEFGQAGWDALIGAWLSPGNISRTTLRYTGLGQLLPGIPESREELSLGTATGGATVILGRDSDASGIADAVVIVGRGRKLSWRFQFDPLTEAKSFRRVIFGKLSDRPFLFKAKGIQDSLALISRRHIIYHGLYSKLKRRIRLPGVFISEPPKIIRNSAGPDSLIFVSNNSTGLALTIVTGRVQKRQQFSSRGTLLIGDFTMSGAETYALLKEDGEVELADGTIYPLASTGLPVSNSLYRIFAPGAISATPLPNVTVPTMTGATPGMLPPSISPTDTALLKTTPPLPASTATAPVTQSPTAVPVATRTPLPTPDASQYVIFVSSVQFGANLGGLAGADQICQGLAVAAGLPGSFLSVLSDSTTDAASRFTINAPIFNTLGAQVASDSTRLWSAVLLNAVQYDEHGTPVTSTVWTGSDQSGHKLPSNSNVQYCEDWSNQSSSNSVSVGLPAAVDGT